MSELTQRLRDVEVCDGGVSTQKWAPTLCRSSLCVIVCMYACGGV